MEEQAPPPSPLSDLSFFRFPEVTATIVQQIILVLLLMVVTAVITVVVQRWLHERAMRQKGRSEATRRASPQRLPQYARDILKRLQEVAKVKDVHALTTDALLYETAVHRLVPQANDEELQALAHVRRLFHLNAMNPNVALVSTRQLLPDLPVRIVANVGEDKLDLYCTLLRVDEQSMLIDVPYQEDIYRLLSASPRVQMLYWREEEGETVFRLELEPMRSGEMPVFRAPHALRAEETGQRKEFRLTVDFPATFHYLTRDQLNRRRLQDAGAHMVGGEARLVDLSYGGAAFLADRPLSPGGFAQLRFTIHDQPVRLMLEVLTHQPQAGRYLVRGRIRGVPQEVRTRLFQYISREQVKRMREREVFISSPGQGASPAASAAEADSSDRR